MVQGENTNLSEVVSMIQSLETFVQSTRDDFDLFYNEAKEKKPDAEYSSATKRARKRSVRITRNEGGAHDTNLTGSEKFRAETFYQFLTRWLPDCPLVERPIKV